MANKKRKDMNKGQGTSHTGAPTQLSDDLKLRVRHQSGATKTRQVKTTRGEHVNDWAPPPSSLKPWRCADRGTAARSHRSTSRGVLAARTSLRGDVEVVGYLTSPGVSRKPRWPRAP